MLTQLDVIAVLQASVALGQSVDMFAKAAESAAVAFNGCLRPAGAPIEEHAVGRGLAVSVGMHHAAGQVFQAAHVQRHAGAPGKPARQADMVGVQVCDDHAGHRPSAQGAGEYSLSNREVIGFGSTASYDSTLNGKVLDLAIREAVDNFVGGVESGALRLAD